MFRSFRLVMLLSAAFVLGACSQSPTGPTTSSQPTATVPKTAPARANPDETCDYTNPWARC